MKAIKVRRGELAERGLEDQPMPPPGDDFIPKRDPNNRMRPYRKWFNEHPHERQHPHEVR